MHEPCFRTRRRISLLLTLVALLLVAAVAQLQETRTGEASYFTGATLLATILGLALIGVRRRLPVLPLGNRSSWTQIHLYTGIFAAGVYGMHVPVLIGSGSFECALSIVFLLAAASGVYGIHASRTLPQRLTAASAQAPIPSPESLARGAAGSLAVPVHHGDGAGMQAALQKRLRLWLVFHGVISLALVAGAAAHAFLAW
jgi:hypothetical protein